MTGHALEKVLADDDGTPALGPGSSCQRFIHLRRAFMKKLLTVLSSRPSCWEMVICISLEGRLFSLKMAIRVRRWRSVNTSRCFLGCRFRSFCCSCSLRLHAVGFFLFVFCFYLFPKRERREKTRRREGERKEQDYQNDRTQGPFPNIPAA